MKAELFDPDARGYTGCFRVRCKTPEAVSQTRPIRAYRLRSIRVSATFHPRIRLASFAHPAANTARIQVERISATVKDVAKLDELGIGHAMNLGMYDFFPKVAGKGNTVRFVAILSWQIIFGLDGYSGHVWGWCRRSRCRKQTEAVQSMQDRKPEH